jgi:hypothetical protein
MAAPEPAPPQGPLSRSRARPGSPSHRGRCTTRGLAAQEAERFIAIGATWATLLPGLPVAGIGSGIANAALGRTGGRVRTATLPGWAAAPNNAARYLGGAAAEHS